MSAGMELVVDATHPISVKYGDTTATNNGTSTGDDNVTITKNSDIKYTAEFATAYLDANATAVAVEVTYYAKITNAATFNVNRDDNTVTVTYSNGPNEEKDSSSMPNRTMSPEVEDGRWKSPSCTHLSTRRSTPAPMTAVTRIAQSTEKRTCRYCFILHPQG